jgi:SAM-dependent methyltransferase
VSAVSGRACPSCGAVGLEQVYAQDGVPIHSCRLVPTRAEAEGFPRGELRLAVCRACGFVANTAYDPSLQDYGIAYEETQGFSPRFQAFLRELAERFVERHGLHGRRLLEIGCGKGEFLALCCELGGSSGVGIDPAFVPERLESEAAPRLVFLRELYGERHLALPADAIVCRHTLEHIADTAGLLRLVRRHAERNPGAVVLFELPETLRIFRETAFWDVYYEHCSYFTPGSLTRLFRATGFEVTALELDYDDQYILLEAVAAAQPGGRPLPLEEEPSVAVSEARAFGARMAAVREAWRVRLDALRAAGKRAAIWGAGSKGVAFLTTLGAGEAVACAVDVNPHKHGMFMAGTGHEIVAPARLAELRPDVVFVMNPIYVEEIAGELRALGLAPQLVPLGAEAPAPVTAGSPGREASATVWSRFSAAR